MSDSRNGLRAKIVNSNHKYFGETGIITKIDRGNVWITLDDGEVICTRFTSLVEVLE